VNDVTFRKSHVQVDWSQHTTLHSNVKSIGGPTISASFRDCESEAGVPWIAYSGTEAAAGPGSDIHRITSSPQRPTNRSLGLITEVTMPIARDRKILVEAARLYYLENHSQADIAARLGTSRSNISRMLAEAQRQGIVEIRIVDEPSGRFRELEVELQTLYGLTDVRVASLPLSSPVRTDARVGERAAQLLLDLLEDSMTVALSWGQALQSMVDAVAPDRKFNVTLVQLLGGLSSMTNQIGPAELVRELALRLGASHRLLHAPAALGSQEAVNALMAESSISGALAEARAADVAFVGIGTPNQGSSGAVLASLNLSPAEKRSFWKAGPVGDIAGRYFDASGSPIEGAVKDRIVGVALEDLVRIPNVVGVAYGHAKTISVLGALRGGLIDSLVCDETLARTLLNEGDALGTSTSFDPGA
jgi:DNA-binding transcriptional regulator LsrR (DeoR family)